EVRRLHADVRTSRAQLAGAEVPAWRRLQPLLPAPVMARRLGTGLGARLAVGLPPDGRAGGPAHRARGTVGDAEGRHMLTAICRYGPRTIPETRTIVDECRARGELIQGPEIARFEQAFARRVGVPDAVAASYGRMA